MTTRLTDHTNSSASDATDQELVAGRADDAPRHESRTADPMSDPVQLTHGPTDQNRMVDTARPICQVVRPRVRA